jgi:hypothetical protein
VSGATGIVTRVTTASGTFAGNDAVGTAYLRAVTGTFQAESVTYSGGTIQSTAAQVAVTLAPDGRFEFVNYNFTGLATNNKTYGCDGVNPAFEYDGAAFLQISTGMTADAPRHIAAHKNHLFLSFDGSLQNSAIGDPFNWTVRLGAAEIGTGDRIVGLAVEKGVLVVLNRNSTYLLYGTGNADWNFVQLSSETGGVEWSMQTMGRVRYLDDRGFTELAAVQEFGDFQSAPFSRDIQRLIPGLTAQCSQVIREKSQYRLYDDEKSAIVAVFERDKLSGFTTLALPDQMFVACSGEDASGREIVFCGADNGYVYQMERGTSFDGAAITSALRTVYANMGSPGIRKRVRKWRLEGRFNGVAMLTVLPDFNYSDESPEHLPLAEDVLSGGGAFGQVVWGAFTWSGKLVAQP